MHLRRQSASRPTRRGSGVEVGQRFSAIPLGSITWVFIPGVALASLKLEAGGWRRSPSTQVRREPDEGGSTEIPVFVPCHRRCRETAPEARWILAGACQPPVKCMPADPPRQGRRKDVGCQEEPVNRLLILEPGVRRFWVAFIVAKVASTVFGTPAGAHNAGRENPVACAHRLISDAPPAPVGVYADSSGFRRRGRAAIFCDPFGIDHVGIYTGGGARLAQFGGWRLEAGGAAHRRKSGGSRTKEEAPKYRSSFPVIVNAARQRRRRVGY